MRSNIIFIPLNLGIQKTSSSVSPDFVWNDLITNWNLVLRDISCCNHNCYVCTMILWNKNDKKNLFQVRITSFLCIPKSVSKQFIKIIWSYNKFSIIKTCTFSQTHHCVGIKVLIMEKCCRKNCWNSLK